MKTYEIQGKIVATITIQAKNDAEAEQVVAHLNADAHTTPVAIPEQSEWEVDLDSHSEWEVTDCRPVK